MPYSALSRPRLGETQYRVDLPTGLRQGLEDESATVLLRVNRRLIALLDRPAKSRQRPRRIAGAGIGRGKEAPIPRPTRQTSLIEPLPFEP